MQPVVAQLNGKQAAVRAHVLAAQLILYMNANAQHSGLLSSADRKLSDISLESR